FVVGMEEKMRMQIHQSGQQRAAGKLDRFRVSVDLAAGRDRRDAIVFDQNGELVAHAIAGTPQARGMENDPGHLVFLGRSSDRTVSPRRFLSTRSDYLRASLYPRPRA